MPDIVVCRKWAQETDRMNVVLCNAMIRNMMTENRP